jgi:putative sterol carrier protein/putative NADPH-quinone reductase
VKQISTPKQIFLYVAPFPALAFFKIWAGSGQTPSNLLIVAFAMFLYCALTILIALRLDKPTYFDWAIGTYFAIASCLLFFWPILSEAFFINYSVTGIYMCLFAAAFVPPLLGKAPFTYHYAKKYTPEEAWGNPIFVRINLIMTYVWAGIFGLCIAPSLYPSIVTRAFIPLALILGFGVPFNFRFPDYYLRRLGLPSLAEQRRMAQEIATREESNLSLESLPTSAWEAISRMPEAFNAGAAGDLSATIGFIVTGSETFEACLNIHDGICTLEQTLLRKPDLLIRTPAEVWLGITRRELDGQEAFMKNAYTAQGNLGILIRMSMLFSGPASTKKDEDKAQGLDQRDNNQATREKVHATKLFTQRKENTMKVLAINSSPRGEGQSKTELMLNHLVKGMREAGADVEVVELRKKKVNNCIGCFTCWTKTPGMCIHKDDMTNELFPKWLESDLVVYATPLYHYTVNAAMKAFIERTLPVLQPFFEDREGRTSHPLRKELPKAIFLSVAGFPEDTVFDQLSSWVNFIFGRSDRLVAEIYRPAAESMNMPVFKEKAGDIFDATTQAGREIVESMKISPEIMARITQDFIEDKEAFAKIGNLMWKTCIAEGVTPKELREKGLIPRPDSVETFTLLISMGFNPEAAGDTEATMQFHFSGERHGSCYFRIENGRIHAEMGEIDNPDLTIKTPFEVWMDIMTGKADGQQMFMEGKYKVNGDLSLLLQMNKLFRR